MDPNGVSCFPGITDFAYLGTLRHSLSRPSFGEPGRLDNKAANITRPRGQETAYRFNENDGVSTRVHELAYGIVICFGIEAAPAAPPLASSEPPGGAPSPSSSTRVAATPASAEPPGGAPSPSSPIPVPAVPASAEPAASAVVPVYCLGPHYDLGIVRWLVTVLAGLAWVNRAGSRRTGEY